MLFEHHLWYLLLVKSILLLCHRVFFFLVSGDGLSLTSFFLFYLSSLKKHNLVFSIFDISILIFILLIFKFYFLILLYKFYLFLI